MKKQIYEGGIDSIPYSYCNCFEFMKRFTGIEFLADYEERSSDERFIARTSIYHLEPQGVTLNITKHQDKDKRWNMKITLFGNEISIEGVEKRLYQAFKKYEEIKDSARVAEKELEVLAFS